MTLLWFKIKKISWCWMITILLSGCAGLQTTSEIESPELTLEQEVKIGGDVQKKLIQLIGGPYHDPSIKSDLMSQFNKIKAAQPRFSVSLADSSRAAYYVLPGGFIVITRGQLLEIKDQVDLLDFIAQAQSLSGPAFSALNRKELLDAAMHILKSEEAEISLASGEALLAQFYSQNPKTWDLNQKSNRTAKKTGNILSSSFSRLAEIKPAYDLVAKGKQYEKNNQLSEAINVYLNAATLAPGESRILESLGFAYLRAGESQMARLYLQEALKVQPNYYKTHMGLGYLFLYLGDLANALKELNHSVSMLPTKENLFLLAEVHEKNGDLEGAFSLYSMIAQHDSSDKLSQKAADRLNRLKDGR